jgi:cellulose biosynthesis protein BcsQ
MEWFNHLSSFYIQSPDWVKILFLAILLVLILLFFALWLSNLIGCHSAKKEQGELKKRLEDKAKLLAEYQADKEKLSQEKEKLFSESKKIIAELSSSKATQDALFKREEEWRSKFKTNEKKLEIFEKTIKSLLSEQGQYWYAPIKNNSIGFRKREIHSAVIFSLINFKGGVGKTFVSLFLALTMMKAGKKVLLIDLDYQGSLTELIVEKNTLESEVLDTKSTEGKTIPGNKTIQQLFLGNPEGLVKSIAIPLSDNLDFIPAWDSLQNVENTAMIRWLFDYFKPKPTEPDVRMRLRALLHETSVQKHYDFIILDCPPRLTTTSVNALCAADYVLIPVIPDQLGSSVTDRLASSLRQFKFEPGLLSPEFKILGLVPNRVRLHNNDPQKNDQRQLQRLKENIEGKWGEPLALFEGAYVPVALAKCMEHLTELTQNLSVCEQLQPYFQKLLATIEDKIKL